MTKEMATDTTSKYTVHSYDGARNRYEGCATKKEARSLAWQRARQMRLGLRIVWVDGGSSWNSRTAIGGYDPTDPASSGGPCAVVHLGSPSEIERE